MNTFGTNFRITTFGESHGAAVGVVIDGCKPGNCRFYPLYITYLFERYSVDLGYIYGHLCSVLLLNIWSAHLLLGFRRRSIGIGCHVHAYARHGFGLRL